MGLRRRGIARRGPLKKVSQEWKMAIFSMRACIGVVADVGSRVEDDGVKLASSCDHEVDLETRRSIFRGSQFDSPAGARGRNDSGLCRAMTIAVHPESVTRFCGFQESSTPLLPQVLGRHDRKLLACRIGQNPKSTRRSRQVSTSSIRSRRQRTPPILSTRGNLFEQLLTC
jgi:hypothetical protein